MNGYVTYSFDANDVLLSADCVHSKNVVVKSGEGALERGQLLAREVSSDKFKVLKTPASITGEASFDPDGTKLIFVGLLANKPIIPGTVKLSLSTGKVFTDDGNGNLMSDIGAIAIDYSSGQYVVSFEVAPDNLVTATIDYAHFGNAGILDMRDIGFLAGAVDASSADQNALLYFSGMVDPLKLIPTIDITIVKYALAFQKLGLHLTKRY